MLDFFIRHRASRGARDDPVDYTPILDLAKGMILERCHNRQAGGKPSVRDGVLVLMEPASDQDRSEKGFDSISHHRRAGRAGNFELSHQRPSAMRLTMIRTPQRDQFTVSPRPSFGVAGFGGLGSRGDFLCHDWLATRPARKEEVAVWYFIKGTFWIVWGIVIAITLLKMHRD
jgi:hypothetical protein